MRHAEVRRQTDADEKMSIIHVTSTRKPSESKWYLIHRLVGKDANERKQHAEGIGALGERGYEIPDGVLPLGS